MPSVHELARFFHNHQIEEFHSAVMKTWYFNSTDKEAFSSILHRIQILMNASPVYMRVMLTMPRALTMLDPTRATAWVGMLGCQTVKYADWVRNAHVPRCSYATRHMCHQCSLVYTLNVDAET